MPKLLYFHHEDWAFYRHFLPMARAAQKAGFEVVVALRVSAHAPRLAAAGCRVIALDTGRAGLGPFEILRTMMRMIRIVRDERPDVVHCINLRQVTIAGLAARIAGARRLVLAPTGLGYLWIENGIFARIGREIVRFVVGRWLRTEQTHYLFENPEDPREFGLDPAGRDVTIVGGAGVDPADFPPAPEPPVAPVRAAVVSRLVATKGIRETVEAVRRARMLGADIELDLYGTPDPASRHTVSEAELRRWSTEPGIAWRGATDDVAQIWREHHVAMLLSYREGLPRTLVEAAAAGRPIVTTDVVGCRDVARDGIEGILVPRGDADAAAQALVRLANSPELRARMSEAAHRRFCERFTEQAVTSAVGALYTRLLHGSIDKAIGA